MAQGLHDLGMWRRPHRALDTPFRDDRGIRQIRGLFGSPHHRPQWLGTDAADISSEAGSSGEISMSSTPSNSTQQTTERTTPYGPAAGQIDQLLAQVGSLGPTPDRTG